MAKTKFAGSDISRVVSDAGHVRVTLSSGTGQGNGGTSIPCKGCYLSPLSANTAVIRLMIGADASATVGIDLSMNYNGTDEASFSNPFYVPIDDVSKLYFFSTQADAVIDILYLKG